MDYRNISHTVEASNDNNNCAVIAACVLTDESYQKVYDTMQRCGRKHGRGTKLSTQMTAYWKLGYDLVCRSALYKGMTINQFEKRCKPANLLVYTSGHVFATNARGIVQDWTRGRASRRKIVAAYVLEPHNLQS